MAILGIDPGTQKAGYAVIEEGAAAPLAVGITALEDLPAAIAGLMQTYSISAVALGRGTHADAVRALLEDVGAPIHLIDERETTLRARALYFADNPPRGWRRLIPLGMQLPPRPVDDYAAVLIARRFLALQR
ncbi:MAG: resolvase [Candidatus Meridianibacter frigidus]|nr:MAG: resolvase [Candidatus Eremiobacteraeota bacterium]